MEIMVSYKYSKEEADNSFELFGGRPVTLHGLGHRARVCCVVAQKMRERNRYLLCGFVARKLLLKFSANLSSYLPTRRPDNSPVLAVIAI